MSSTKSPIAIDFQALAKLTKDNKTAGIIMLLSIDASNDGQVSLTNKAIIGATGMDRKNVSVGLGHLREKRFLLNDPVCDNVYHINSQLLRTYDQRTLDDADFFPEFSSKIERLSVVPKVRRARQREVKKMNKLTDSEISTLPF